jgi:hypothetical protein
LAIVSCACTLACGSGDTGAASIGESGEVGLPSTEAGVSSAADSGVTSDSASSTDPSDETASDESSGDSSDSNDSSSDGPPVLDVIPDDTGDDGGMPPDGIPETCAEALLAQSTVGCSFRANKMQNFQEEPTSVVVGNVSETETALIQLYWGPGGVETAVGTAVSVAPLATHEFVLNDPVQPGDVSVLRVGGSFRVESDVPIVAYQHSPIAAVAHNDSSMLLPDHAQGKDYVVASYQTTVGSDLSYFNVVGIYDGTEVTWTPPQATNAGNGVPAVAAAASTTVTLNEWDMLQVTAASDVSGTIIESNLPVWAVGAVPCVNVPANVTFCDHIEEQLLPLDYWGQLYVGAHAPTRGSELYHWRIYSGDAAVTITTTPAQLGTPATLDKGEFVEFTASDSFMISADGPIMPVQYLEGQDAGAGTGDPASYQMVPTEQFLERYVFVTGTGYTENYVQVIRPAAGAEIQVDGIPVTGFYAVGAFEVADWPVSEGPHVASSPAPFGVVQVGYTGVTSYAYPGGLALGVINPQPD